MALRLVSGGYETVAGSPRLSEESRHLLESGRDLRDRRRRWVKIGVMVGLALGATAAICRGEVSAMSARTATGVSDNTNPMQIMAASPAEDDNNPSLTDHPAVSTAGSSTKAGASSTAVAPLAFKADNFYHVRDGKPGVDYPWLKDVKLIEPHRETTLSVAAPRAGFEYHWQIRAGGSSSEVHTSATGAEAVIMVEGKHLDENLITLEEVRAEDGAVVRRLDEFVMVKYVRREIRTLTDDEREELFDAMFELWRVRVQGGNGRDMYGDGYSDIWAINRLHFKAASPQYCDHFHDGLGFLTSHGLLSNTFEYSLQQVNPKLTLPYWDFTIESSTTGVEAAKDLDDVFGSTIKTPLFQESWFGSTDPVSQTVQGGRWVGTIIPKMRDGNPSKIEPDVYSKLRSPWNVNSRPYLTRGMGRMCSARAEEFYPWPTCEMHYDLATSYTDFYSWVWESLYDPHGPVHIWIGGVVDCEDTYVNQLEPLVGKETARSLALLSFVYRKDLFRDGIFSCQGSADAEEQPDDIFDEGVCGCHGYDLTQGDDYLEIFKTMVFMEELMEDSDDDTKRELVRVLCTTTSNDGDHLQSSSSLDPSFWSTHPTMERLWMYSVLTGQITDIDWPDADVTYTSSDGTVYTESISKYAEDCIGHRGSDVFPFDLLANDVNDFTVQTAVKGSPEGGGNTLTNREVLAALDPRINALSYVYDTFEWTHCEADGFDLKDAWIAKGETGSSPGREGGAASAVATGHGASGGSSRVGDRQSVGGRTVFEKGALRLPMYGTLKAKMADLKARKAGPAA